MTPRPSAGQMRVQLVRKLANMIDGVDISTLKVGDVVSLPLRDACLLIAEGWAVPLDRLQRAEAAERSRLRNSGR